MFSFHLVSPLKECISSYDGHLSSRVVNPDPQISTPRRGPRHCLLVCTGPRHPRDCTRSPKSDEKMYAVTFIVKDGNCRDVHTILLYFCI